MTTTLPFSTRSTISHYRKKIGSTRIILALAVTLLFLRWGVMFWVVATVGTFALIAIIFWFMSKRQLKVTNEAVSYENGIGGTKTFTWSDVDSVMVFTNYSEPMSGIVTRVSIASKTNKYPMSVTGLYWPEDELKALPAIFKSKNIKTEFHEEVITSQALIRYFPKYATMTEQRPALLVFIVIAVVLVVVAAAAAVLAFS